MYTSILFGLGTDKSQNNSKLSRLYGEKDAIAEAAKFKGCEFTIAQ